MVIAAQACFFVVRGRGAICPRHVPGKSQVANHCIKHCSAFVISAWNRHRRYGLWKIDSQFRHKILQGRSRRMQSPMRSARSTSPVFVKVSNLSACIGFPDLAARMFTPPRCGAREGFMPPPSFLPDGRRRAGVRGTQRVVFTRRIAYGDVCPSDCRSDLSASVAADRGAGGKKRRRGVDRRQWRSTQVAQ